MKIIKNKKRSYTDEMDKWLINHYPNEGKLCLENFNKKFNTNKDIRTLRVHCNRELKLKAPTDGRYKPSYTEIHYNWVKEHYGTDITRNLVKDFNAIFGFNISNQAFERIRKKLKLSRTKEDRLKHYQKFRSKITSLITEAQEAKIPVGTIVVLSNGYKAIKISNRNGKHNWKYLHRYVYEQTTNSKIKPNECIVFLDKNPLNCDFNNLKLVDKIISCAFNNYSINNAIYNEKVLDFLEIERNIENILNN